MSKYMFEMSVFLCTTCPSSLRYRGTVLTSELCHQYQVILIHKFSCIDSATFSNICVRIRLFSKRHKRKRRLRVFLFKYPVYSDRRQTRPIGLFTDCLV